MYRELASKIKTSQDLDNIKTMGFREALTNSEISVMEIKTKSRDHDG